MKTGAKTPERIETWYVGSVIIAGVCWLYLPMDDQGKLSAETLKTFHTHRITAHSN